MNLKACTQCGKPTLTTRCADHRIPTRGRPHRTASATTMAAAKVCWICGQPPRPGDPLTADHIIPLAHGGTNTTTNYQAAHYSCNSRRGAA
jgi:hypothetical protein